MSTHSLVFQLISSLTWKTIFPLLVLWKSCPSFKPQFNIAFPSFEAFGKPLINYCFKLNFGFLCVCVMCPSIPWFCNFIHMLSFSSFLPLVLHAAMKTCPPNPHREHSWLAAVAGDPPEPPEVQPKPRFSQATHSQWLRALAHSSKMWDYFNGPLGVAITFPTQSLCWPSQNFTGVRPTLSSSPLSFRGISSK